MSIRRYSEPFQPTGSIDAQATRRTLGQPRLGPWALFLRETLQNSWDARLEEAGPIDFCVDAWHLDREQLAVLRREFFVDLPPVEDPAIREHLSGSAVPVLVVTDTGTRGLRGPTRADVKTDEPEFVDFVRNIGRDHNEKGYAGGTYGFGKGVLYEASSCSTVILFTRSTCSGVGVSRFMAAAVGTAYTEGKRRYTGRHWWGVPDDDTGVEPVVGAYAEDLARRLGLTRRLPQGATGTALMVLAPRVEAEFGLRDIVDHIAAAASWYAWPHMVEGLPGKPSINFSFTCEGQPVDHVLPEQGVLGHYASCYRLAERYLRGEVEAGMHGLHLVREIRSERPDRRLGVLVSRSFSEPASVHEPVEKPDNVDSGIALMRTPRLVVRYWEVPGRDHYPNIVGVFIADPELDEKFALSEPVAHDDWVPENIQSRKFERNPVRQALERLRKALQTPAQPSGPEVGESYPGLVALSTRLGEFLRVPEPAEDSEAGGRRGTGRRGTALGRGRGGGGASRAKRPSLVVEPQPRLLAAEAGSVVAEFDFRLDRWDGRPVAVTAEPLVVLDGSEMEAAGDAPAGAALPVILGWRPTNGTRGFGTRMLLSGDRIVIRGSDPPDWTLRIRQPLDTAVTVRFEVQEAG